MTNFLKKLVSDWREFGDSPTLVNHQRVKSAYYRCAGELEAMIGATEALGRFIKGTGVGLPHGTIAWVMHDGKRYIREWHPMMPDGDGKPQGNWWDLDGGRDAINKRFSEHEVTHYSIIEIPPMPSGKEPSVVPRITAGEKEFDIIVGRFPPNKHYPDKPGRFFAYTTLLNPHLKEPVLIHYTEDTEEEAVQNVAERADAVLRTFFTEYKIVRL